MEVHSAAIRLFIPPEEITDYESFKRTFLRLLGIDSDAYCAADGLALRELTEITTRSQHFRESRSRGFEDRPILVLEGKRTSKKTARLLLTSMIAELSVDDRRQLKATAESRIDEDLNCYIRLDKHALIRGESRLVDHGSCYHFTFNLVTYPKRKSAALEGFRALIG